MMSDSTHKMTALYPAPTSGRREALSRRPVRKQLNNLMKKLNACTPWYIRCIKPNHNKKPNRFENGMCLLAAFQESLRPSRSEKRDITSGTSIRRLRQFRCVTLRAVSARR